MASRHDTVRVTGYRELLRACNQAEKETKRAVRNAFREVGTIVRDDAADRLADASPRSAAGLRVRVRQRGVAVEQSLRKTTGTRPDWGKFQMREALLPAAKDKRDEVEHTMNDAIDHVADYFERKAR